MNNHAGVIWSLRDLVPGDYEPQETGLVGRGAGDRAAQARADRSTFSRYSITRVVKVHD
jgi:hypothetical protein